MKYAIVVGQSTSNKCLVAYFDGGAWVVDSSFPSITGRLWGAYFYDENNVWV